MQISGIVGGAGIIIPANTILTRQQMDLTVPSGKRIVIKELNLFLSGSAVLRIKVKGNAKFFEHSFDNLPLRGNFVIYQNKGPEDKVVTLQVQIRNPGNKRLRILANNSWWFKLLVV
ncbi:MAG TPA: hypothetical protein VJ824_11605 [Bacillota bacterium]|nr:hypothetical protein [Bacillota bacterium]